MTTPQPLSNCCGAPMNIAGSEEGTRWHECTKCGGACDGELMRSLNEQIKEAINQPSSKLWREALGVDALMQENAALKDKVRGALVWLQGGSDIEIAAQKMFETNRANQQSTIRLSDELGGIEKQRDEWRGCAEALAKALDCFQMANESACDGAHHSKADQHEFDEQCPVCPRGVKALAEFERLKKEGR